MATSTRKSTGNQRQPADLPPVPTIHLGITMAGAVSAGAYTAGVMDYFIEAMRRWEEVKATEGSVPKDLKKYPWHKVSIDAISGASAGGITSALTALACFTHLKAVETEEQAQGKSAFENILFDTWVNLADDSKKNTIHKMLSLGDLKDGIP